MSKKLHDMAVFIEFIVGSALATFFHIVLHQEEAAYVIFGIGVLLALATWLIREEIAQSREHLVDQYDHAHEITFAIARMTDPECQSKAQEIIATAKRSIVLLQQGYIPRDEAEFYMKGAKYLDESCRRVLAVDPVTMGWDCRGALVNYYQANLRAVQRGVEILRIFVIQREELKNEEVQKLIGSQLRDGIRVRVAFRDELPAMSDVSGRDTVSSFDFALYDGMVVTEVFSQPGKYFGCTTRKPALIANYQRLFNLIEHSSHAVVLEGERILLPAEMLPLAS